MRLALRPRSADGYARLPARARALPSRAAGGSKVSAARGGRLCVGGAVPTAELVTLAAPTPRDQLPRVGPQQHTNLFE